MDQIIPLLVTAVLLLVPLVPAAILYLLLTPKARPGGRQRVDNSAAGRMESGRIGPWQLKLQFNVVGSTATYVVLLALSFMIYNGTEDRRLESSRLQAAAMRNQQAWLVEVPVNLKGPDGSAIAADTGQLQQVRVELEPNLTMATSNSLQFWVIPNNDRFPTARLTIPSSIKPSILDLNDARRVDRQYDAHKLNGIEPVWLQLGQPYAAR
jgi:hypothetical protein